jgi:hypothetical protein
MHVRRYIKAYAVSPLGIANAALAVLAGFVAGSLAGVFAGLLAGVSALGLIFVLALHSGIGPRFAAAEHERRLWAAGKERLAAASAEQRRLASIRVPDPAVRKLVELVALQAGMFISSCDKARQRDPLGEDAITESLELVDLYLKELDDAATERRYALPDDDSFADAVQRVSAALRGKAALLEKARLDIEGGLQREDRMAIKEQL